MSSFSKNSLITFFTEILTLFFAFLTLIIIARILGPTGQGIYSLTILIPGLMLVFGSFGIETANIYFVGSKKYKIEDVVANSLVLSIFLGFILILIFSGLLFFQFFQDFIYSNKIPIFYLWIAIFTIPLSLFLSFFRNIIRGVEDIASYNKIRIAERSFQLIAIIIFLLALKKGIGGAVYSYFFSAVGGVVFSAFLIKKISNFRVFLNKNLLKDSFVYGSKVYIANTFSFLNARLSMILIAFFLTPFAVGLYSVAVGIAEKLSIVAGSFAVVLFPKISSITYAEANSFTPKVVRHTFFIMIIAALFLAIFAIPLIKFFLGSSFLLSVWPLLVLLPGIIASGVGGVIAADLGGRGRPEFAFYGSLACLIVNVILNIFFIPKFGLSGAALATSIAYWIDTIILLAVFLKISKKSLFEVLIIKKQDFSDYSRMFLSVKKRITRK